jgi:ParB family chromosome partitioning protein
MEKRKVLGRGLETLLPSARMAPPAAAPAPPPVSPAGDAVHHIAVELIDRNPYQTRMHVEEPALDELAASIRASGVLQPITVRPLPEGRYQLITGWRRWLGSQRAGKTTVPAIVRQVSNEQAMEMTIVENLQREDLNPIEEARAFERLSREFGLTQEQIAIRTGKERASVANFLRLLKLPAEVQTMIQAGELSMGHAKVLMALDTPSGVIKMAERIRAKGMSVRRTEEYVDGLLHPVKLRIDEARTLMDPNVREAEQQLERCLGMKVRITDRKGKGKILLEYRSLEDFDRIVEALTGK